MYIKAGVYFKGHLLRQRQSAELPFHNKDQRDVYVKTKGENVQVYQQVLPLLLPRPPCLSFPASRVFQHIPALGIGPDYNEKI